ncbi:hypothetical protein DFS34DRAFT_45053 [Phlyctochytrium arcticum]|nr:hypothetical protein DFS34DRAFT_45053 [Phlyctochytrium arcticum]
MIFWSFVPNLVTNFLQKQYYKYFWGKRAVKPSEARFHFRVIYSLVVLCYLAYTFVEVERGLPSTYYDILGVSRQCDAKDLKTSFRQLTLELHPDKLPAMPEEERALHEYRYVHVRQAYETLKEPMRRQMYDKFGEVVHDCIRCVKERDYLMKAIPEFGVFYVISTVVLCILSILGVLSFGRYWRFAGLLVMCAFEARILFSSADSGMHTVMRTLIPWRTPHEHIVMLHQFFVVLAIAISQLGPMLFPESQRTVKEAMTELDNLTTLQLVESQKLFSSAFEPYADDPNAIKELKRNMEKLTVDLRLHEQDANLTIAAGEARMRLQKRK